MLGRLHSLGRIAQLDDAFGGPGQASNSEPNFSAAFWHLQKAAHSGHISAILAMARLYSGLLRDIALEPIPVTPNVTLSLHYHILAAQRLHLPSASLVAKSFHKGLHDADPAWDQAVHHYHTLLDDTVTPPHANDPNFEHYGFSSDLIPAAYEIHAALAELYQEGGHGLEPDLAKAFDHWNTAGELATAAGKGRLANQYFEKSAECDC